jgi:4-hydroxybenzoate polyprenyltransferase
MRLRNQVWPSVEVAGESLPKVRRPAFMGTLRARALWREAVFLVKASRPGFWLTALWFYLLPFGGRLPLDSWAFWLGVLYVGMPLGMLIYASNDVSDERTDGLNPRKDSFLFGARPTPAQIAGLPLRIFLVQLPFVLLFCWLLGPRALGWFAGVAGVTLFYNGFAKDRPVVDVLAQAGYLMVFVLANWLGGLPPAAWTFWVFGALFAMHSHLFGEIMDIAPDSAAQRRTTAVAVGARTTKIVVSLLLVAETALAMTIPSKPWLPLLLGAGAVCFVLDALLWRERPYPAQLVRLFFIGWNLFLLGEILVSFFLPRL